MRLWRTMSLVPAATRTGTITNGTRVPVARSGQLVNIRNAVVAELVDAQR